MTTALPEPSAPHPRRGRLWLVLAALGVLLWLAAQVVVGRAQAGANGEVAALYARAGDTFVRLAYLADYAGAGRALREQFLAHAATQYGFAAESDPSDPTYGACEALVLAGLGKRQSAARTLSQALLRTPWQASRASWRPVLIVLTSPRVRPEWATAVRRRLSGLAPGPLFTAEVYQRLGDYEQVERQRQEMEREGLRILRPLILMVGVCGVVLAWGVVGAAWGLVALVRWLAGARIPGPPPPALWSATVVAQAVAAFIGLHLVAGVGLAGFALLAEPLFAKLPGLRLLLEAATTLAIGMAVAAWVKSRPPRGASLGWDLGGWQRQVAAGLAAGGAMVVPGLVLAALPQLVGGGRPLDSHPARMLAQMVAEDPVVLVAVLVCGAAPVVEETVFRGIVFRGLRGAMSLWRAALLSSLAFGLSHGSLAAISPAFALGLVTALLCERYRSLVAPAVAHTAYNAFILASHAFLYGA